MTSQLQSLTDALAQKAARIERCVARAQEELAASPSFLTDFTRQDATILNIQRACELTLDMAIVQSIIRKDLLQTARFAGQLLLALTNAPAVTPTTLPIRQ